MKSFKQFILEIKVQRHPKVAEKLFHYIVNRREKYGTDLQIKSKWETKNIIPDFYGTPDYSFGWHLRGGELQNIPVKKIRSSQTDLTAPSMPGKIHNMPEYPHIPEHPEVIYNHKHDIYHLRDGNHRVASALLRRDEFIEAVVFHPVRKIP